MVCFLYFREENWQRRTRKRIYSLVTKYEEELLDTVEFCLDKKYELIISKEVGEGEDGIYYTELNNELLNKMFKTFHLCSITIYSDGTVYFMVRDFAADVLLGYYEYGFYYSENGVQTHRVIDCAYKSESVDVWECEGPMWYFGKYWYRMENIKGNWWLFEGRIKKE